MTAFLASVALLIPAPAPSVATAIHGLAVRDHRAAVVRPYRAHLERIAACESGGRWHIATGNGFYGGLQFTLQSWLAVGGHGLPNWYSRLEQMFRAVLLQRRQGWNAWPVCAWR